MVSCKKIKDKSKIPCGFCKAYTVSKKPCKKLASCKIGCKNFCALHAESLGGTVKRKNSRPYKCEPPYIKDCYSNTTKFPCKKKLTYFWSRRDWRGRVNSIKRSRTHKSQKRSRGHVIRSYEVKHPSVYVTRSRKVKFQN